MATRLTGSTTRAWGAILALVLTGLPLGRPAFAQATWYVNPSATGTGDGDSWENAFTSLQPALTAAQDDDSIWIRGGSYKPTTGSDRSATFTIAANITLYGGFAGTEDELHERDILANPTILSGDLNGDDTSGFGNRSDNSHHVVTIANVGDRAVLDGLIIRGGNADGTSAIDRVGGGVVIIESTPTSEVRAEIRELSVIEECSALAGGGAIGGEAVGLEVRDVLFRGNRALGGASALASGGGAVALAYLRATRSRFEGNVCEDCPGGAAKLDFGQGSEWSSLVNVEFIDNAADGSGGGLYSESEADLANCLFARNVAGTDALTGAAEGGGLFVKFAATVLNCTVADNIAHNAIQDPNSFEVGVGGGILAGLGAATLIRNTVLWGNRVDTGTGLSASHTAQTNVFPTGSVAASSISHSLVENYLGCLSCPNPPPNYFILGDNVILHDPLFADPASDNYLHRSIHITDYGDDGSLPDDLNDLDDDNDTSEALPLDLPLRERVRGTAVDLGAYEWCVGDLNGDGLVEGADLGWILGLDGQCGSTQPCLGDLDGDGAVDGADLGILLGNWDCGFGSALLFGNPVEGLLSALGLESMEELWELLLELGPAEGAELVSGLM